MDFVEGHWRKTVKSIDGCFKFLSKVDLKLGLWRLLFYIQLFFIYYFDLGVGLMERGKIIRRIEPDHVSQFPNVESRYKRSREVLSLFASHILKFKL